MKYCSHVLGPRVVVLFICIAVCTSAFAQGCYTTGIVNKSNGNNTNVGYDDKNNIVSLTYTLDGTVTTYTVTNEKTLTGYKKTYVTKVDNTPAMAFTPARTVLNYNNANRLQFIDASN